MNIRRGPNIAIMTALAAATLAMPVPPPSRELEREPYVPYRGSLVSLPHVCSDTCEHAAMNARKARRAERERRRLEGETNAKLALKLSSIHRDPPGEEPTYEESPET